MLAYVQKGIKAGKSADEIVKGRPAAIRRQ
jgi:hypothetical protein